MKRMQVMAHVVVGYPSLKDTISIMDAMAESGVVDMIELQIPFSDPLADGPTILHACEESLKNGTKVNDAFDVMKHMSSVIRIPLLFMAYYNTVFQYGTEQFCRDAKAAGAYGLIVPDMALDEECEEHFISYCKKYDLHNIRVISPASTTVRLKKNASMASGFVYATAHQGITGIQEHLDNSIEQYLKRVKKYFTIPIAVGFGISTREHIERISHVADIAILGSVLIKIIEKSEKKDIRKNIQNFLQHTIELQRQIV